MATPMDMLTYLRDALAQVAGVTTCRIGIEADMTPADYPIIRLVPSRLAVPASARNLPMLSVRQVELLIYFGQPIEAFEAGASETGLENLYREIFALERAIIDALPKTGAYYAQYVETITDEDRSEAYKLMVIRCVVQGQA